MGCSTSQHVHQHQSIFARKPQVWLIGGGPGSNRGKIIQYLIRDYKFKYLSSFEIIQLQKDRNGPDAAQIKQLISQKKDFPSQLVIRLIKKVLASLGPRRFLIDGFPRNTNDILEYEKQISPTEVLLKKFIHIEISDDKMKKSGMEALKDEKKDKTIIEKQVAQIVQNYRKDTKQILNHYQNKGLLLQIDGQKSQDQAYHHLRNKLNQLNVRTIQNDDVRVLFAHFDSQVHQVQYCDDLTRKYGLYYYNCRRLIQQARRKNGNQARFIAQCEKNKSSIPPQFVIDLIRKKIQKKDYYGDFLISGFPRFISDAQEWDRNFGWETSIQAYLTFQIPDSEYKKIFQEQIKKNKKDMKPQEIATSYLQCQENQQKIWEYYKEKNQLLKLDATKEQQMLHQIDKLMSKKGIEARKPQRNLNLVFVSMANNMGEKITEGISHDFVIIDMLKVYNEEIKQNNLHSELIHSYISSGKPIPGRIAVTQLLKNLQMTKGNKILVRGFPNSLEQLLVWQEQVGLAYTMPKIIYYQSQVDSIKALLYEKKVLFDNHVIQHIKQESKELEQFIESMNMKRLKILHKTTDIEIMNFLAK